ncbi:MAG: hypothetical protein AAGL97_07065 [Pseudomonadota bacterium]
MKTLKLITAAAFTAGLLLPMTAHAAPQNAKQFKNAMQNASQARLNRNGSNILRFDADQNATMTEVAALNSSIRANGVHIDDSLISNLDTEQDATVRQTAMTNSSMVLNSIDMTRARSVMTEIDQDATVRKVSAVNSSIAANTISIR